MFGFLNINKPCGMTSRQVVDHVQRLVRPLKAGHAGTLDPLASGVLVVGVGQATRLIDCVHQLSKRYDATFLLGRESDTEDITGHVQELPVSSRPSGSQIDAVIPRFLGEIRQRPPAYSALKVRGERAYALARAGETVELVPRLIRIDQLTVLDYEYPRLRVEVTCGSGTYVRSLGRDLAEALGTAAVMSELTRLAVGCFELAKACSLAAIDSLTISRHLQSPTLIFAGAEIVTLDDQEVRRVLQGQSLLRPGHRDTEEVPAVDASGRLVALLTRRDEGRWKPTRTFPYDR